MPRMMAWTLRNLAHAAWMSPDDTPEKRYFLQKLRNNVAVREGVIQLTQAEGGLYQGDPVRGVMWSHGRSVLAKDKNNPLRFHDIRLAICEKGINEGLLANTCLGASLFMEYYINICLGILGELFDFAHPMAVSTAQYMTRRFEDNLYNPFLGAEFHSAVMGSNANTFLTSWSEVGNWLATSCTMTADVTAAGTSITCSSPNWMNIQGGRVVQIGNELIKTSASSVQGASGGYCPSGTCVYTLTVASGGRGWAGTQAAAHSIGGTVTQYYNRYSDSHYTDVTGGYTHIYRAAGSMGYSTGTTRYWEWLRGNALNLDGLKVNTQWALMPRNEIRNLAMQPGSTEILFDWTAPSSTSCSVAVNATRFPSSLDTADLVLAAGPPARSYLATGLNPATTYYYRITCGTARSSGTIQTRPTGSAVDYTVSFAPQPGLFISNLEVEHGSTQAYGTTLSAVACSTGCTVTLPGLAGNQIHYLRWRWLDSAMQQVGQPGTRTALVK